MTKFLCVGCGRMSDKRGSTTLKPHNTAAPTATIATISVGCCFTDFESCGRTRDWELPSQFYPGGRWLSASRVPSVALQQALLGGPDRRGAQPPGWKARQYHLRALSTTSARAYGKSWGRRPPAGRSNKTWACVNSSKPIAP